MRGLRIDKATLDATADDGIITRAQADALWQRWSAERAARPDAVPRFSITHILYYLGGMIAIGAMTLFMNLGWERFGPWALFGIAVAYAVACIAVCRSLAERGLPIPAGILATLAIALVPLATWAFQSAMGWWPPGGAGEHYRAYHTHIDWRWITLEFATLIAAVVGIWRLRYPFMVMPLAVTLWYMSMDLTPFLFGGDSADFFSDRGKLVSLYFGLAMTLLAFIVDIRSYKTKDFAFWLYLFGVLAFWGGLSSMRSVNELNKFLYCCVNLLMIAIGAALSRRVFAVFGGLGVSFYLGYLSHTIFRDSMLFPVALTAIGLAVIAAGVYWQRHEATLGERLRSFLPARVRELLAHRAE